MPDNSHRCARCGAVLSESAPFCSACGARVEGGRPGSPFLTALAAVALTVVALVLAGLGACFLLVSGQLAMGAAGALSWQNDLLAIALLLLAAALFYGAVRVIRQRP